MPKFFIPKENIDAEAKTAVIEGDGARHIARSLRMAVGDFITVSDGEGTEYSARLTKIRDEKCELVLCERILKTVESPIEITLFMAYPKSDKLETVVQKATELGASVIVPFESSRCIKRPPKDKADARRARLSRIAEEAAKQCGRGKIPVVENEAPLCDVLRRMTEFDLSLFCYEGEGTESLRSILSGKKPRTVAVVVGSEGGFSEEEARAFAAAGAKMTGLGPRILRCETAPDYVLSAISYEFEL